MFLLLTRYHYWLDNINATWLYQYVLSNDNFLKINYMFFISKSSQLHPKLSIIFLMCSFFSVSSVSVVFVGSKSCFQKRLHTLNLPSGYLT
jgi:hypothetical protein